MCQALFREQVKDYAEFFALFLLGDTKDGV